MCGVRAAWLVGHSNSNEGGGGSLKRVNWYSAGFQQKMRIRISPKHVLGVHNLLPVVPPRLKSHFKGTGCFVLTHGLKTQPSAAA